MNSYEWTTLINAIANMIAKDKTEEEIELIIALLGQLEYTLAAIAILNKPDE